MQRRNGSDGKNPGLAGEVAGGFLFAFVDMARHAQLLAGKDLGRVLDLVAVGLVQERPEEGIGIDVRVRSDEPERFTFADGVGREVLRGRELLAGRCGR